MIDDHYIKILDNRAFGELVKKWSRGEEIPPVTIAEFKSKVAPTVLEIGPGYGDSDTIDYYKPPAMSDQLSFVIPDAKDISEPIPADAYPLPSFYSRMAFGNAPAVIKDIEAFRSCRIADYCGNKCM